MMYVKIHHEGDRYVIAICDEDLIGKTLEEGDKQLKISEHFYKGEKKSEEKVVALLKKCPNANFIGEHAVKAGIKAGVIKEENVILIGGVPHAQAITL